jgi:hypothetical protein
MIQFLAMLALKSGATHAAVSHKAASHVVAAHAAAAHAAATGAGHAVIAAAAIDAATIGGAAFVKLYSNEVGAQTANAKRNLSPYELRAIRDTSCQKVREAMRRAFTPAEEAELKLIYARLGI